MAKRAAETKEGYPCFLTPSLLADQSPGVQSEQHRATSGAARGNDKRRVVAHLTPGLSRDPPPHPPPHPHPPPTPPALLLYDSVTCTLASAAGQLEELVVVAAARPHIFNYHRFKAIIYVDCIYIYIRRREREEEEEERSVTPPTPSDPFAGEVDNIV
ncbi:hypothetical protein EYF80_002273 [Liparis tanakae]|uniref:Uncharacterized protein n=1 Tax=Liparis tanakae TaxID=230148 RepID=A0A4Z2JBH6_9TELE|nr:hypothetical protein EYF80_002273 [Liparis tanakae]